jgi:valyl-tRNA synthetase
MSKSLGNVVAPSQITEGKTASKKKATVYGVDVLR